MCYIVYYASIGTYQGRSVISPSCTLTYLLIYHVYSPCIYAGYIVYHVLLWLSWYYWNVYDWPIMFPLWTLTYYLLPYIYTVMYPYVLLINSLTYFTHWFALPLMFCFIQSPNIPLVPIGPSFLKLPGMESCVPDGHILIQSPTNLIFGFSNPKSSSFNWFRGGNTTFIYSNILCITDDPIHMPPSLAGHSGTTYYMFINRSTLGGWIIPPHLLGAAMHTAAFPRPPCLLTMGLMGRTHCASTSRFSRIHVCVNYWRHVMSCWFLHLRAWMGRSRALAHKRFCLCAASAPLLHAWRDVQWSRRWLARSLSSLTTTFHHHHWFLSVSST